jgi:hypothetical protein
MMPVAIQTSVATMRRHGYDVILFYLMHRSNDFQRIFVKSGWNPYGHWGGGTPRTPRYPAVLAPR